jgi:hypothetical protein
METGEKHSTEKETKTLSKDSVKRYSDGSESFGNQQVEIRS